MQGPIAAQIRARSAPWRIIASIVASIAVGCGDSDDTTEAGASVTGSAAKNSVNMLPTRAT